MIGDMVNNQVRIWDEFILNAKRWNKICGVFNFGISMKEIGVPINIYAPFNSKIFLHKVSPKFKAKLSSTWAFFSWSWSMLVMP